MKYFLALDVSLSDTGVAIFTEYCKIENVFSIPTTNKMDIQHRLRIYGDALLAISQKYDIVEIAFESGFSKFPLATQQLYKCHGIASYIFSEIPQFFYAPTTIKKMLTGDGKAKKEAVWGEVSRWYPNLDLKSDNESDAVAVMLTHFNKTKRNWK
jgi:crossover junction endodeoxyribonuclease RuvC